MISVTEIKKVWIKGWEEFIRNTEGYGLHSSAGYMDVMVEYILEETEK